ncbi:hypothetical protein BH11BAC6_BH11BAC6_04540 [soil metagenome]
MQSLNKKHFLSAASISGLLAAILFICSYSTGKQSFFLLLNGNAGIIADNFFEIITWGGDGIIWIPALLIILFIIKRKDAIVLTVTAFVLSTVFVQGIKNFINPGEPRPTKALINITLIHTVNGVEVHSIGSFPSGHTATAFCIYFIFCLLLPKRWWIVVGFIYAALVGYSRVYLAQHFPSDVAAGIIVAILSVWLAVQLQQYFWKRKALLK